VQARPSIWVTASGGLARLVVILGLLVGLTALQGTHCSQDLQLIAHTTMCPTTVAADDDIGRHYVIVSHHGAVLYAALTADPHFPVGVAGMCVALLVSVLLFMIGMARPGLLGVVPLRAGPQRAAKRRTLRAPSLAMICVLRT
jgi:hypothetical protein